MPTGELKTDHRVTEATPMVTNFEVTVRDDQLLFQREATDVPQPFEGRIRARSGFIADEFVGLLDIVSQKDQLAAFVL